MHAWTLCDQILLQRMDPLACYFASQTLKFKISKHLKELPEENYPPLRESLINHLRWAYSICSLSNLTPFLLISIFENSLWYLIKFPLFIVSTGFLNFATFIYFFLARLEEDYILLETREKVIRIVTFCSFFGAASHDQHAEATSTQLCLAIADLYIQVPQWNNWIADLLNQ